MEPPVYKLAFYGLSFLPCFTPDRSPANLVEFRKIKTFYGKKTHYFMYIL